jgi:ATP-binding protein involved in chromosome partitioning
MRRIGAARFILKPNLNQSTRQPTMSETTENQPSELEQKVRTSLSEIKDPETGRPLSKQIHEITADESAIKATVGLTTFALPIKNDFEEEVKNKLASTFPDHAIEIEIAHHDRPAQPKGQVGLTAKAVIAVAAGKGGVGKSTAATSLAIALNRAGCKTGLLDADVYGPSLPQLTGIRGAVTKVDNKIQPLDFNGIPLMSIGFMVPPDQAVIWRGPMLHSAVTTFVRDTAWGDLDYLIIDMPPGTGDIALSLSQLMPLTGAVIVCTPQEVALIDAVKAVGMFRKVKIPILGLIENMSSFVCPDNGKEYDIFGKGGAKKYASQDEIEFLGDIPINIQLRERGDAGEMAANFEDPNIAPYLEKIAYNLTKSLAQKAAAQPVKAELPVLK